MEDKLLDILDDLNISETSLLLEKDFDLHIDKNVKKRIMDSVKSKSQLQFKDNENILHKFKNIFSSLFINRGFAMIMAIFILVTGTGRYVSATTPVAYVSLDINPSIELAINKFKKVISYEAYNSDGEILLGNNDKCNITVDQAISNIISSAISEKYLLDNNNSIIAFAAISNNLTVRKTLQADLKNTVNNTLKSKSIEANVISSNDDFNKRLKAKNLGFTVSKYTLVEELKSLDSDTVIKDYKNMSIINIEKKILKLRDNTSKETNTNLSDSKTKVDYVNEYSNKNINSKHTDKSTNNNGNANSANNNHSGNSNSSNGNSNSGNNKSSNGNSNSGNNKSSNGNSNSGNNKSSNGNSNSGNNKSSNGNSNSGNNKSSNGNSNSGNNKSSNGNNSHNRPNKHRNPGHNHHNENINYGHNYHNNDNNYRYNY